jgi:hypothetical protein
MDGSSPVCRQETEGHLRTHPKLCKLELKAAIHEAWELGQAMSNPSSLEKVPASFQRDCGVYISYLGPAEQLPRAHSAYSITRRKGPRPGPQQAAQLGLDNSRSFLTFQRGQ